MKLGFISVNVKRLTKGGKYLWNFYQFNYGTIFVEKVMSGRQKRVNKFTVKGTLRISKSHF